MLDETSVFPSDQGATAKSLIAEEFSAERMAANYLRVYEDALTQQSVEARKSSLGSGEKG